MYYRVYLLIRSVGFVICLEQLISKWLKITQKSEFYLQDLVYISDTHGIWKTKHIIN